MHRTKCAYTGMYTVHTYYMYIVALHRTMYIVHMYIHGAVYLCMYVGVLPFVQVRFHASYKYTVGVVQHPPCSQVFVALSSLCNVPMPAPRRADREPVFFSLSSATAQRNLRLASCRASTTGRATGLQPERRPSASRIYNAA